MMAFELYEKGTWIHSNVGDTDVSIAKSSMSFGVALTEKIMKKGYIEVYFDRDSNKVGIHPTTDSLRGFKVTTKGSSKRGTTTGSFLKMLPPGIYNTYMERDYIVFEVNEIAKKIQDGE